MIVEFLCRYSANPKSIALKEIEEELNIQEIIQGEKFNRESERETMLAEAKAYEYGPVLFDFTDIESANPVDKDHTMVKYYTGMLRILKISYDQYKAIYSTVEGKLITSFVDGINPIDIHGES